MSESILEPPLCVAQDARGEEAAQLLALAQARRRDRVAAGDGICAALALSATLLEDITKQLGTLSAQRPPAAEAALNPLRLLWLQALKDALAHLTEMRETLQSIQAISAELGQQTRGVQTPDFKAQLDLHGRALDDGLQHLARVHRALVRVAAGGFSLDAALGALVVLHGFAPLWARVRRTCTWHWAGLQ